MLLIYLGGLACTHGTFVVRHQLPAALPAPVRNKMVSGKYMASVSRVSPVILLQLSM